jgi:hypothetical protein
METEDEFNNSEDDVTEHDDPEDDDPDFDDLEDDLDGIGTRTTATGTTQTSGKDGSSARGGSSSKGAGGSRSGSGRRKGKQVTKTVVLKKARVKGKQRKVVGSVESEEDGSGDEQLIRNKRRQVADDLGTDPRDVSDDLLEEYCSVFPAGEGEPLVNELDDLSALRWGPVVDGEDYHFLREPEFFGESRPTEDPNVIGELFIA